MVSEVGLGRTPAPYFRCPSTCWKQREGFDQGLDILEKSLQKAPTSQIDGVVVGCTLKTCTKCKVEKALEAYSVARDQASGLRPSCRECHSAQLRARYAANPGKYQEGCSRWRLQNPEAKKAADKAWSVANAGRLKAKRKKDWAENAPAMKEVSRKWRSENKEIVLVAVTKWQAEHPERVKQYKKTWKLRNPEAITSDSSARRRAARAVPWQDEVSVLNVYREARRQRNLGNQVVVDHAYPLRGRLVSGLHVHQNLRLIPKRDNQRKGNKLPGDLGQELWDPEGPGVFHG